jgi:hypothetical protein
LLPILLILNCDFSPEVSAWNLLPTELFRLVRSLHFSSRSLARSGANFLDACELLTSLQIFEKSNKSAEKLVSPAGPSSFGVVLA